MELKLDQSAPERPEIKQPMRVGLLAVLLFTVGFTIWSFLAPISSAALATGQVRVESYRKTVQHLEGGILRELLVKEGDVVRKGQVLARLDDTQAGATTNLFQGQRDALKVLEARLVAERDGLSRITFEPQVLSRSSDPAVAQMIAGQERIFATRSSHVQGQVSILQQKIEQLRAEIEAYRAQALSADQQIGLAREEAKDVRQLLTQGLSTKPRLLALERHIASLVGSKGQYNGMMAKSEQAIAEARMEMGNLRRLQATEVTQELREVQTKLGEFEDRLRAAVDVRSRTVLVAPQAGRVVKIRHFTQGAVLQPGEALLDIVPEDDILVIEARVSPYDIDNVQAGLAAEVKFSAYKQKDLPVIMGNVTSVSADALIDERTGDRYYTAQVSLSPEEMSKLGSVRLYPGMPAEVFIVTGKKSAIRYFVEPLTDSYRRSFRES